VLWSERSDGGQPVPEPDVDPPHHPLPRYYAGPTERRLWLRDLFSRTAVDYDRIERAMAFGSGAWYRRRALREAGLGPGMTVVDVGVGTGLVACEAARIVGDPTQVTGVDPSPGMVAQARVPAGVRLLEGTAERLPLADASADFISMGFALRHVDDLGATFAEFRRVLRAGGRLCVLEITRPESALARALLKAYMRGVVPWVAGRVARHHDTPELMRYYWDTIEACVPPATVLQLLRATGFVAVERQVDLGIFSAFRARKAAQ
jgi:demethylmenaquinone methyltransferase / 2-methoxy-6-polyprenyl-1,4-benzoquinol methylase